MREELIKKYESLTITNDFIFGKVMEDMAICQEILSRIVGFDVGELRDANIQVSVKETIDGRGIRLDSLTEGMLNSRYNSEMQVKEEKQAGRRIRYYQGNLDITSLQEGDGYENLPEIYMIFICTHDLVGDGRYKHEFIYTSKENPQKVLDDGSHRIIINVNGNNEEGVSPELKELIDYMRDGICKSGFIKRIHEEVCRVRVSRKCREDFMRYTLEKQQIQRDSREEGRAEGIEQERAESEKRMSLERLEHAIAMKNTLLAMNLNMEDVKKAVKAAINVTDEELEKLMVE